MGKDRRKSVDSEASSGSEDGTRGFKDKKDKKDKDKKDKKDKDKKDHKDKDKKDKKDKDKKDKDKKDKKDKPHGESSHGVPPSGGYGYGGGHDAPFGSAHQAPLMPQFPVGGMGGPPMPSMPHDPHHAGGPAAPHSQAPPSGFRVPMNSNSPFPNQNQLGQPPAWDHGGQPLYFASVLFERSVHPAKAGDHLGGKVAVSYGGQEQSAPRFDLLPFDPTTMELIPTSRGQIPHGRRPVEGGYEENGEKLYHAIGQISGVRVPGKTGVHLQGGNFPYGGAEQYLENYELLVWRY